jgi:hypothetical protein
MTNLLAFNDLSVHSGINPAFFALLAAIFITLLGGMMMPAFVAMARTSVADRLTRAAVWAAFKSTLARWVQVAIAVLTSSAALVLVIAVIGATPAAAQKSPTASTAATATSDATVIEQIAAQIKAAKKPLPAWAADLAMKAYDIYKTHQNGKRVGVVEKRSNEIEREVIAILKVVADVQTQVEAGQAMTDREFRLTRDLLDVHAARLDDITGRVTTLEAKSEAQAQRVAAAQGLANELQRQLELARKRTQAIEKELIAERERVAAVAARLYRPGCGTGSAYRGDKCVDVAANPK